MSSEKSMNIFLGIGIAAVTSILCAGAVLYFYNARANSFPDSHYKKYGNIINSFFSTIRQGNVEAAYKSTSPVFQMLTSLDSFKNLITDYEVTQSIPASPCVVTQYSDPFPSTIASLSGTFNITQTKCEVAENHMTKGFDVEFVDDHGTPKISYINAYSSPVMHTNGN